MGDGHQLGVIYVHSLQTYDSFKWFDSARKGSYHLSVFSYAYNHIFMD